MNNTLIITGGDLRPEFVKEYMKDKKIDIIIAVDGGLTVADMADIKPDYIIGDFDTVNSILLFKYENMEDVKIIRYKPEKDSTDTGLAIQKAIEKNSFSIHILGATGTRFDHTISNILLLQTTSEAGIDAMIVNENNRIRLLGYKRKIITLTKKDSNYKYVSLIPLSEKVTGITTKGMKYNISNYDFYIDKEISMGVSNEIEDEVAEISVVSGKLLLVESND